MSDLSMFNMPSKTTSDSDLPSVLSSIGVDHKGLAMNGIGRIQLEGRLLSKFGQGFQDHPQAKMALSAFDKVSSQLPMSAQDSESRSFATAKRTLSALFGDK